MKKFDWFAFFLLLALIIYGIVAIYSASTTRLGREFNTQNFYIKQLVWAIISLVFMYVLIKTPYTFLEILIVPAYILTVILLILVIFMPEINGSHRWIPLGIMNFQPSEMAKLVVILMIAKFISLPYITGTKIVLRALSISIIPFCLILLEPDLGTALTIVICTFAILSVSDLPFVYIILIISPLISIVTSVSMPLFAVFILGLLYLLYRNDLSKLIMGFTAVINIFIFFITPVIWNSLKNYQQNRILSFLDPMRDPFGSGYQIIQSKIAIGSGGFMGKGILLGTQKNMNFLPEHHTDFIFSVIGEEFGFFGCAILLLIYFLFLFRIAKHLEKLKRKEYRYATTGILAYLTFQIFVNIGMNIGIVPTTGIPLPFISYGGSNLLINVMAIGFVLKFVNERSIFK